MITVGSGALLPVIDGDLQNSVAAFVSVLRDHCLFDSQTHCSLDLITARPALLSMIARALPANAEEFTSFGPASHKMTAAEFLEQSPNATRADKACSITLTNFLTREQIVALLSELAGAVPPSGRGVFLILFVNSAILRGVSQPVRIRMSLGRPPKGKQRYGATIFCEFAAKSKSDPAAKRMLQELRDVLGLEWKKLVVVPDLRPENGPSAQELVTLEQCVQEAFAQAALDLDEAKIALDGGPQLQSQVDAMFQRKEEVTGEIREKIDFRRAMRQFMQLNLPGYSSCSLGGSAPSFRKRLGEQLDGVLTVERLRGFAKCFTVDYHVDFPGTRFAGRWMDPRCPPRSLFLLFHQGLIPPVWAYAVSEDLERALAGLGRVLSVALPAMEKRLREFLSPIPEALPSNIQTYGRLSAREAYELARRTAEAWSADSRFVGVHSGGLGVTGYELSRGVDLDGRLQPHGRWVVRFQSRRLSSDLLVEISHTGQIRWNSMARIAPLLCSPPSTGWMDSTVAMQIGLDTIRGLAPGHEWTTWECGIVEEQSLMAVVWRIHVSFRSTSSRPRFRDAYVYLDPVDKSVIHSTCLER